METRDDILKELKEIAPKLASLNKTNPYKAPEGYFLTFKNTVLEKVKLNEVREELKEVAPELNKISKTASSQVPADYFNTFSSQLLNKIKADEVVQELAEVAPTLSKLEKVNTAEVPANYFNAFPTEILNKLKQQEKQQPSSVGWIQSVNYFLEETISIVFKPKYVAAFTGMATMMIVGAIMFIQIQQCSDLDCKMAQLSTEEINAYLDTRAGVYSEEIFESDFDDISVGTADESDIYNEAFEYIDDAALDAAIMD